MKWLLASHAHGLPDIITTFACDLEWPEIVQGLEHGQKAVDRTDITVRVHQMKLLDYLQKISTGQVFGTVVAELSVLQLSTLWSSKRGVCPMHVSLFGSRRTVPRDLNWLMLTMVLLPLHLLRPWKLHLLSHPDLKWVLLLLQRPVHKKNSSWSMLGDKHECVVRLFQRPIVLPQICSGLSFGYFPLTCVVFYMIYRYPEMLSGDSRILFTSASVDPLQHKDG